MSSKFTYEVFKPEFIFALLTTVNAFVTVIIFHTVLIFILLPFPSPYLFDENLLVHLHYKKHILNAFLSFFSERLG